jgi:hypothetical protein
MKPHTLRLYVASVTLLVFFVLWAVIAAKPWASASSRSAPDPRLVALERRQHRLQRQARQVKQTLDRRWHAYRARLRARQAQIRELERRHAQEVAAAAAAAAAAGSTPTYSSTSAAAAGAAPATRVVTLPPQVKVVTLPPTASAATSSGSSHP